MAQQGFNPFAPQMQDQKQKSPQLQGVQAPNVAMQEQPGLVQTLAPSVFNKAMGSETAGEAGGYLKGQLGSSIGNYKTGYESAMALNKAKDLGYLANAAKAAPIVGWEAPALAEVATAATTGAEMAAGLGTAGAAGAGTASVASAAPMAAALGPFGIPILIGAGLMAANSGK